MTRSLLLVAIAFFGLPALVAAAPIYRCAAPGGGTVFSQVPCGKDAATVAGSQSAAVSPAVGAKSDKAAMDGINGRCETESHRILDSYSARFAEANASIAEMHKRLMVPGTAEKDPAVQKEITEVEARKTELLGAQDREIATLRNRCQVERTAELQRRADRDAQHPVVKR